MNSELILVDDDDVLLVIFEKMIHKVDPGIKLIPFNSGKKALSYLSTIPESGTNRYLLVDINLKDMSGWDFLNELVERKDKFSKVILITSSVNSSNPITAKKYVPVIGFFEKPLTFEIIHQILNLIGQNSTEKKE
ncbi:response regulator [Algoriphagus lacus]|uniref:Response regulator n=1 Tax=Algoriphagus lacus TaxID=2056311 RepID=A0A418PQV4_9BACT|nr:response regulator [Algoriphagus lacus]RIW14983.1 response regulator [Algoriphagus lacus]